MLGCLSMGLLFYIKNEQTQQLCQLMKSLDSSSDYVLLTHQLLRGAYNLLWRATNIKTGCRLALLNTDLSKALIFEPDRKQLGNAENDLSHARGSSGAFPDAQIHVTEISLENTLLLDAVQKGKARFVSDCASYIQSCMKPATDIFISGQEMVASIVVLPLIYEGTTFGGFYVTLETTSNFQNIKDLLMGFVNSVVLVLQQRLQSQQEQIWDAIMNVSRPVYCIEHLSAGMVVCHDKMFMTVLAWLIVHCMDIVMAGFTSCILNLDVMCKCGVLAVQSCCCMTLNTTKA